MEGNVKSKEDLTELARKVINSLRPERLQFWQVKEVLVLALKQVDKEALEMAVPESTALLNHLFFLRKNYLVKMPDIVYILLNGSVGCKLTAACYV